MSGNAQFLLIQAVMTRDYNKIVEILSSSDNPAHPQLRNAAYGNKSALTIAADRRDLRALALLAAKSNVLADQNVENIVFEACETAFAELEPQKVIEMLSEFNSLNMEDLILKIIARLNEDQIQSLIDIGRLYHVKFSNKVWQKLFMIYREGAASAMLLHGSYKHNRFNAAFELLSTDQNNLDSFLQEEKNFQILTLTAENWEKIFNLKYHDNYNVEIIAFIFNLASDNDSRPLLRFVATLIVKQHSKEFRKDSNTRVLIEEAIYMAARKNEIPSLKLLIGYGAALYKENFPDCSQKFDSQAWVKIYTVKRELEDLPVMPAQDYDAEQLPSNAAAVQMSAQAQVEQEKPSEPYVHESKKIMVENAIKYNNINLFLAALYTNSHITELDIPTMLTGWNHFLPGMIKLSKDDLSIVRDFIFWPSTGDFEINPELIDLIFKNNFASENIDKLVYFLRDQSRNEKIKLVITVLNCLPSMEAMDLINSGELYKSQLDMKIWEKLISIARSHGAKMLDLFQGAIKNYNINLILVLLRYIKLDEQLNYAKTLAASDFRICRLILSEISKAGDYKDNPLWQTLQELYLGSEAEPRVNLNAKAVVELSSAYPIKAEVMLMAQDLLGLTEKIEKQGKDNPLYNPILLHAAQLHRAPSESFIYYMQNYSTYNFLFDLPIDAKAINRFNLLKYMLRHYEALKNIANYETIVASLIDENVFPKFDIKFVNDVLGYNDGDVVNVLPPILLNKILIPMGLGFQEGSSQNSTESLVLLCNEHSKNNKPLEIMLAAEFALKELFPDPDIPFGAQTAHDVEAAKNFDYFAEIYKENDSANIPDNEQLTYIRLFMLYSLYLINPTHDLIIKLLEVPSIKDLFEKIDYKDGDYPLFYANYQLMREKSLLLEYTLDRSQRINLPQAEQSAIDLAIRKADNNYYAEQALVCLRTVRESVVGVGDMEMAASVNSQFLINAGLREGTANLIKYIHSDNKFLEANFQSHRAVLKALLSLSLIESDTESKDRSDLFKLYEQNKDKEFAYSMYAEKLEEIFDLRLKNDRSIFCIQVADAITAYLQEGQEASASLQSCLVGYKSRLNQLLDGDIIYGRLPSTLEMLQKFLIFWMRERLQAKLSTVVDNDEKLRILGRFLSTRISNAALLAAGKGQEMLVYYGNDEKLDAASLLELSDQETFEQFYLSILDQFHNNEVFNPEKNNLNEYGKRALNVLLLMGGGEVVIAELDNYFREQYGIKEERDVAETTDKEQILKAALEIENKILAWKQALPLTNTMLHASSMAEIRSKISSLIPLIINYNYKLAENDPRYDEMFDKLKQELVELAYRGSGDKQLANGEFVAKIESVLQTQKIHEPTKLSNPYKPS